MVSFFNFFLSLNIVVVQIFSLLFLFYYIFCFALSALLIAYCNLTLTTAGRNAWNATEHNSACGNHMFFVWPPMYACIYKPIYKYICTHIYTQIYYTSICFLRLCEEYEYLSVAAYTSTIHIDTCMYIYQWHTHLFMRTHIHVVIKVGSQVCVCVCVATICVYVKNCWLHCNVAACVHLLLLLLLYLLLVLLFFMPLLIFICSRLFLLFGLTPSTTKWSHT